MTRWFTQHLSLLLILWLCLSVLVGCQLAADFDRDLIDNMGGEVAGDESAGGSGGDGAGGNTGAGGAGGEGAGGNAGGSAGANM